MTQVYAPLATEYPYFVQGLTRIECLANAKIELDKGSVYMSKDMQPVMSPNPANPTLEFWTVAMFKPVTV